MPLLLLDKGRNRLHIINVLTLVLRLPILGGRHAVALAVICDHCLSFAAK